MEVKEREYWNKKETYTVYLGFITIDTKGPLKPTNKIGKRITHEQANEIINLQRYGVADVGEHADHGTGMILVKSNHSYYHHMEMLGYKHEQFEKMLKVEDYGFDDDTMRCGECGLLDSRDDGYTYNFREAGGDLLGVNCGCYDEFCKANFAEEYGNNHRKAIERSTGDDLEKAKKIKRLETFIGGMVDGRGGYYKGQGTREGTPEAVLKEYRTRMPKKKFVFIHEESGQFQQYFSIAEVRKAA